VRRLLPPAIKTRVANSVQRAFRFPPGYVFYPAPSVEQQEITFRAFGVQFTAVSDYRTPLYETIAEIADYDCYQLAGLPLTEHPELVVIDVGANVGISALALSALHQGPIVCFEPIPDNCSTLQRNLERNSLDRVTVLPYAIGSRSGRHNAHMDPDFSVSARTDGVEPDEASEVVAVDMLTLDEALAAAGASQILLMKLDCEGAEYDILEQLDERLARRIRFISLEVHDVSPTRNVGVLKRQLEALGYMVTYRPEMQRRPQLHHLLAARSDSPTD
jgi:FkbM family methyltransferase